jgi:peptidoglycan/LPS O-acetylase OafA/YrhL
MNQVEIRKYDFIDALRAWAIIAVIIIHVALWVVPQNEVIKLIASQGGQGVGLFFMASSLTLFLSMATRNKNEQYSTLKYFIRRFFRIAPLFYFGMICYTLINGVDLSYYAPDGLKFRHFILTALFMHGWFPDTINAIVPGGWSIATEMTFYLFIPVLFAKIKSIKTTLFVLLISIFFAKFINTLSYSFFNSFFNNKQDLVYAFQNWWFIAQLPVFLIGILLFHTIKSFESKKLDKQYGTILLGISIFLCLSFLKTKSFFDLITPYYFYALAFYVFALSLFINPNIIFVNKITKFIGKYSYSLYITHFAIIEFVKNFFKDKYILSEDLGFLISVIIVICLSILASILTFHLIEKPGINLGRKIIERIN